MTECIIPSMSQKLPFNHYIQMSPSRCGSFCCRMLLHKVSLAHHLIHMHPLTISHFDLAPIQKIWHTTSFSRTRMKITLCPIFDVANKRTRTYRSFISHRVGFFHSSTQAKIQIWRRCSWSYCSTRSYLRYAHAGGLQVCVDGSLLSCVLTWNCTLCGWTWLTILPQRFYPFAKKWAT